MDKTDPTKEPMLNPHVEMGKWMFRLTDRFEALQLFYDAEVIAALYDALTLVRDSGCEPPDWVIEGAIEVVAERLKSGKSLGPGQSGNELKKYQNAKKHLARYMKVLHAKKEGQTWDAAYTTASEELLGTFAVCSPAIAKKSYIRVNKDMQDDKLALKYYFAMGDTNLLTKTSLSTGCKIPAE